MDIPAKGRNNVLDVEDDEQRHDRLHGMFAKLNASAPSFTPASADPRRKFDFGDRTTFPAAPPLALLARVQAFLPKLAASNADLARRAKEDPGSVDIECLGPDEQRYIEMNLGLGVFEQHGAAPPGLPVPHVDVDLDVKMSDSDSSSTGSSSSSATSSPTEGYDDSDDSDSDIEFILGPADQMRAARLIRPLPRRRSTRPPIVVLPETPVQT